MLPRSMGKRDLASRVAVARGDIPADAVLTGGRVLKGAKSLAKYSKIKNPTLVDASSENSHLDPLTAAPDRNKYLSTVVPFLKKLGP